MTSRFACLPDGSQTLHHSPVLYFTLICFDIFSAAAHTVLYAHLILLNAYVNNLIHHQNFTWYVQSHLGTMRINHGVSTWISLWKAKTSHRTSSTPAPYQKYSLWPVYSFMGGCLKKKVSHGPPNLYRSSQRVPAQYPLMVSLPWRGIYRSSRWRAHTKPWWDLLYVASVINRLCSTENNPWRLLIQHWLLVSRNP